jgi:hypothetical protein
MSGKTKVGKDERLVRADNIPTKPAKGWRLVTPGKKAFKASLLNVIKVRDERLAIFRVFPNPK